MGNVDIREPRGCYDESKRFGETLTVAYEQRYDLNVRTVRIFNTYGPRMRVDDGRVVPTFLAQALLGEDLTVYGDGFQTRSFCYASDLVRGLRAAMGSDTLAGDVINLGRENERTSSRSLRPFSRSVTPTARSLQHVGLNRGEGRRATRYRTRHRSAARAYLRGPIDLDKTVDDVAEGVGKERSEECKQECYPLISL